MRTTPNTVVPIFSPNTSLLLSSPLTLLIDVQACRFNGIPSKISNGWHVTSFCSACANGPQTYQPLSVMLDAELETSGCV